MKLKSPWGALSAGMRSIGEGLSTFSIWPDTDYERFVREFEDKHLREAPGFAKYRNSEDFEP
jgi:hypothetical protein